MKARDVMSSPAITVSPETALKDAIQLLVKHQINGMPVVASSGELIGVVTEADLLKIEVAQEPIRRLWTKGPEAAVRKVGDVMTGNVTGVPASLDLPTLAGFMLNHHLKTMPVMEGERVIGVVTRRDIIEVFVRGDDEIRDEVQTLLHEEIDILGRFKVEVEHGIVALYGTADKRTSKLLRQLVGGVPGVVGVDTSPSLRRGCES